MKITVIILEEKSSKRSVIELREKERVRVIERERE